MAACLDTEQTVPKILRLLGAFGPLRVRNSSTGSTCQKAQICPQTGAWTPRVKENWNQPGGPLSRPPGAPLLRLAESSASTRLPQKTSERGGKLAFDLGRRVEGLELENK